MESMGKPTLIATVVLVFVVGLVFGSFSGLTDITSGQVIRDSTATTTARIVTIDGTADPSETVSGRVMPGVNGAERYVYIYSVGDIGQLQVRKATCQSCFCAHGNICFDNEDFTWKVPIGYSPGRYAFVVTDAQTGEKVYDTFTVGYRAPGQIK